MTTASHPSDTSARIQDGLRQRLCRHSQRGAGKNQRNRRKRHFRRFDNKYNFYRAVDIVCDGIIYTHKRYARLAEEKMRAETDLSGKRSWG